MTAEPVVLANSVPKPGEVDSDNEDRVAFCSGRIAMSDGASRTARAEVWAELLVESFAQDASDPLGPARLELLRAEWLDRVASPDLPWYAQSKIADGGAATYLSVEIDTGRARFAAVGIGDTCLLHVRGGDILLAGPLTRPDQFGRSPALVSTRVGDAGHTGDRWECTTTYKNGDALIIATDAAAAFLLGAPTDALQELIHTDVLNDSEEYSDWVNFARSQGGMASDDTTICVVRL
jgi:hypothetical protein